MTNENVPQRETVTYILPVSKKKVILKSYLIGKEKMEVAKAADDQFIPWAIKNIVVSGITLTELEAAHGKDFDFLVAKMGEIMNESSWLAKKKDSLDNTEKS